MVKVCDNQHGWSLKMWSRVSLSRATRRLAAQWNRIRRIASVLARYFLNLNKQTFPAL